MPISSPRIGLCRNVRIAVLDGEELKMSTCDFMLPSVLSCYSGSKLFRYPPSLEKLVTPYEMKEEKAAHVGNWWRPICQASVSLSHKVERANQTKWTEQRPGNGFLPREPGHPCEKRPLLLPRAGLSPNRNGLRILDTAAQHTRSEPFHKLGG